MNVREIMSPSVKLTSPGATLQGVAQIMAEFDTGVLPVGENDRLIGMITDRDIVVGAVSKGLDPRETTVREVMTADVHYCYDSDDVEQAVEKMGEWRVRRLPVLNKDKRLVGILSLGDASKGVPGRASGAALRDISQTDNPPDSDIVS